MSFTTPKVVMTTLGVIDGIVGIGMVVGAVVIVLFRCGGGGSGGGSIGRGDTLGCDVIGGGGGG